MNIKFLSIVLFLALSIGASAQVKMTQEEYILKYKDLVLESQEKYGIPASIKMAQGLVESGNGTSRLAIEANNHFGIKCKNDWKGKTITHDDDAKGECFRKYSSAKASFMDHSEFLDSSPRYASLFDLKPTDYKGWAKGLKAAGYATHPQYAEKLIDIIERFELYTLDTDKVVASKITNAAKNHEQALAQQVSSPDDASKVDLDDFSVSLHKREGYGVYVNNGSEYIIAKEGDLLSVVATKMKLSSAKLLKYNDLAQDAQIKAGDKIYIKVKSKRSINGKLIHQASQGETLWSVSQKYGIRLKDLSKLNKLKSEATLHKGQQIRLM